MGYRPGKIRKYVISLIKIGVMCLLVWYLFRTGRLGKESFEKLLKPDSLPFLALSAVAFLASQVLSSVRLVFFLRIINIKLVLSQVFRLTMMGNFFNMVIPGMVGGDIVKGFYLAKAEESQKGRSSGIIIVDRALGLFALLIIGAVSIVYLSERTGSFLRPYQRELHTIMAISGFLAILFVSFIVLGKSRRIRRKLKDAALRIFRQGFFYNIIEGFGAVTKKRRYLVYTFLLSIVIQLICLAGLLVLININTEGSPDILSLMAVSSLVMLMGVVPVTPGNIGWTELLATFGWSAVGAHNGAEIFFYWRIVTMLCSLPGGIFYFYPVTGEVKASL